MQLLYSELIAILNAFTDAASPGDYNIRGFTRRGYSSAPKYSLKANYSRAKGMFIKCVEQRYHCLKFSKKHHYLHLYQEYQTGKCRCVHSCHS